MKQYHDILRSILKQGTEHRDRTGVGTISHFGFQTRFDLRQGFHWRQIGPCQLAIDEGPLLRTLIVYLVDCLVTAKVQYGVTQRACQLDQARKLQERMPSEIVGDLEGVAIKVRSEEILIECQQLTCLGTRLLHGS